MLFIQFKNGHKCLLRDLYIAYLAHSLFPFLLFFQQLSLSRNISPITFGGYILTQCFYGLPGNNFSADGGLYRNIKLLPWNLASHTFFCLYSGRYQNVQEQTRHQRAVHSVKYLRGPAWRPACQLEYNQRRHTLWKLF